MSTLSTEILLFILGMFTYGIRAAISKWLVSMMWKFLKKYFLKTERDVAYFLHVRNLHIKSKYKD